MVCTHLQLLCRILFLFALIHGQWQHITVYVGLKLLKTTSLRVSERPSAIELWKIRDKIIQTSTSNSTRITQSKCDIGGFKTFDDSSMYFCTKHISVKKSINLFWFELLFFSLYSWSPSFSLYSRSSQTAICMARFPAQIHLQSKYLFGTNTVIRFHITNILVSSNTSYSIKACAVNSRGDTQIWFGRGVCRSSLETHTHLKGYFGCKKVGIFL